MISLLRSELLRSTPPPEFSKAVVLEKCMDAHFIKSEFSADLFQKIFRKFSEQAVTPVLIISQGVFFSITIFSNQL